MTTPTSLKEALATEPKPLRGHPGFSTVEFKPTVGLSRPRVITVLLYDGKEITRGSRSDLLAVLKHEPTKRSYIERAKAL